MAEITIKPIYQLDDIPAQNLSDEDFFPVYDNGNKTGKITAEELKNYIFKNQNTYAADSTFDVDPITVEGNEYNQLTINKKSLVITNTQLNKFYEQMGVPLKVEDNTAFRGIKHIKGNKGITISSAGDNEDTIIISYNGESGSGDGGTGIANIKIQKGDSSYIADNDEDGYSNIIFSGNGVELKDGTISINDNNTILQAYKPGEEPVNIKSIKEGTGINFSLSEDSDQGRELTIENSSTSSQNSQSLKLYEVISTPGGGTGHNYTCSETFVDRSIIVVHFNTEPIATPVRINGIPIKYLNNPDDVIQIIKEFAILEYIEKAENDKQFKLLASDRLPEIKNDISFEPAPEDPDHYYNIKFSNGSAAIKVLINESYKDQLLQKKAEDSNEYIINPDLIDATQLDIGLKWEDIADHSKDNDNPRGTLPVEYLPDGVGNFIVVDGTEVGDGTEVYESDVPDFSDDTLIFNNGAKVIPVNKLSGKGASIQLGNVINDPYNEGSDSNTTIYKYVVNDIVLENESLYLINFKYGLGKSSKIQLEIGKNTNILRPIYYNGSLSTDSALPAPLITNNDNVLFYFCGQTDNSQGIFYLLAVDNAMGERVIITPEEGDTPSFIKLTYKGDTYTIPTDNLSSKTITSSTLSVDNYSSSDEVKIDLNLPLTIEGVNNSELFLNGEGNWTTPSGIEVNGQTIHYINSPSLELQTFDNTLQIDLPITQQQEQLLPYFYPIGSIYQTINQNFNPNGTYIPVKHNIYDLSQWYIFTVSYSNSPVLQLPTGSCWLTTEEITSVSAYWDLVDYNNGIITWIKKELNSQTEDIEKIQKIRQFREYWNNLLIG